MCVFVCVRVRACARVFVFVFVCASAGCSVCVLNACGMLLICRLPRDALASSGRGRCGRRTAQAHRNEHTKTNIQKRTCKNDEHVGMGLLLWHSDGTGPVG